MLKRLLLVRGAELLLFALLASIPLAVTSPYALGLLTLLAIYGILLITALAVRPTGVFGKAAIRKV